MTAPVSTLFYGDNLDVLRRHVAPESVDLCYVDPPFNSRRDYNQIYNNTGSVGRARAQAFVDTWRWDDHARAGLAEIMDNAGGRLPRQTLDLIDGLRRVLGDGSLLAYLVSMTLRLGELHHALRRTGSLYLHCDPTASHYLKLVLDSIFVTQGGDIKNEIIWHYRRWTGKARRFQALHDTIFFYTKSEAYTFNPLFIDYTAGSSARKLQGKLHRFKRGDAPVLVSERSVDTRGVRDNDVWQIPFVAPSAKERRGYPTQKPERLLEKIITASSDAGDVVLDAYCGCGTTLAVAQRLDRAWIGIDITFPAIAAVLQRLEDRFGKRARDGVVLGGVPRDVASARALARRAGDRAAKEFAKWAVLTYTGHRGVVGDQSGIDGTVHFMTGPTERAAMILRVGSGGVDREDVEGLRDALARTRAAMATFITLEEPTAPMIAEAKAAGRYRHAPSGREYDRIQIVAVREIVEAERRLDPALTATA